MRAWLALALVLGATGGCDVVLGLDERPGVEIAVTDLRILGTPPTIDDVREVRATVHGAPNGVQAYELTATAGDLVPGSGDLELDDNGEAELTSMYRATARGPVTIAAQAGAASATVTFDVFELVIVGLETGTSGNAITQNLYVGSRINLGQAGELKSLGVTTNATMSTMGRFGVYTNDIDRPGQLLVEVPGAQAIMSGRNVFAMPPTMVAAGDYWLVGIFDTLTPVQKVTSSAASFGYASGTFADPMPTMLSGWGTVAGTQLAFFVGVQLN